MLAALAHVRCTSKLLLLAAATLLRPAEAIADAQADLVAAFERGQTAYSADRFAEAAPALERAIALAPSVFGAGSRGPVSLNAGRLMQMLGVCYMETLRISEAESQFQKCIQIGLAEEGPASEMALQCQSNLGELYRRLHLWSFAEQYFKEVLSKDKDRMGSAITRKNLAYLLLEQDRLPEAEAHFKQALPVFAESQDRDARLDRAACEHGLGMAAHKQGRHAEAQRLFTQALQQRSQLLPADHRWMAHSKGMLAAVYAGLNRDAEARPLLADAEKAMRAFWGSDHPDVAMELHELGLLLERSGDLAGSVSRFDESRRTLRTYSGRILRSLSTDEQLRFLAEERNRFMDVVAIAKSHPRDVNLIEHSLEWVINEKGLAQETLAERELLARQAEGNPQLKTTVTELAHVRQQLVALAAAGNQTGQKDLAQKLAAREIELVRQLGLQGSRNDAGDPWVPLSRVRAALPKDTVLIELVRLDRQRPVKSSFDARVAEDSPAASYIAWLLHGDSGKVQLVDLGSARAIEAQVDAVQRAMNEALRVGAAGKAAGTIIEQGPIGAEAILFERLSALSALVLKPLVAEIPTSKRLIISPDDALWLVPWSALPLPQSFVKKNGENHELHIRYAVEELEITHLVSGRDLLASPRSTASALGRPVIFADPEYDTQPPQRASAKPPDEPTRLRAIKSLNDLGSVTRLPSSADEARQIQQPLAAYSGQAPAVLLRQQASEGAFYQLRGPAVAMLSTHGFFRGGASNQTGPSALENPLLKCGLALAGFNQRQKALRSDEDGMLTGLEIVGADLRGTRLVVLSACETGLGGVRQGEGVAGLRQAFQLAGAQSVVATLWSVEDQATGHLIIEFFKNLGQGQSKAEALRKAQIKTIQDRRARGGDAHPFFWAAFTLTGNAR